MPTWKVPPVEPCDSATLDAIMAAPDTLIPTSAPVGPRDTTPSRRTSPIVRREAADAQDPADVTLSAMPATVPAVG